MKTLLCLTYSTLALVTYSSCSSSVYLATMKATSDDVAEKDNGDLLIETDSICVVYNPKMSIRIILHYL